MPADRLVDIFLDDRGAHPVKSPGRWLAVGRSLYDLIRL